MSKLIDLTGQKFNKLLVLERAENYIKPCGVSCVQWKCICDCGNECIVIGSDLKSGNTKSCGCGNSLPNLVGVKIGKLTVLKQVGKSKSGHIQYLCVCGCKEKNKIIVTASHLMYGHTQSCGCLQKEKASISNVKHSNSISSIYKAWSHIKGRCYCKTDNSFKNYGGRTGKPITVCRKWLDKENGFINFYNDVSVLPHFGERGYTLDRIDNNGNYEIDNVRWATSKEQNNNKRNNFLVTYNGKTLTLKQWCVKLELNYKRIWQRIRKYNWDIDRALSTPVRRKKNAKT